MRISTKDTAMPMAMATLMRASGMGIPTVTNMDIHMRICTMAMATPMRASITGDMDMTMSTAMGLQASRRNWTLSLSGPT